MEFSYHFFEHSSFTESEIESAITYFEKYFLKEGVRHKDVIIFDQLSRMVEDVCDFPQDFKEVESLKQRIIHDIRSKRYLELIKKQKKERFLKKREEDRKKIEDKYRDEILEFTSSFQESSLPNKIYRKRTKEYLRDSKGNEYELKHSNYDNGILRIGKAREMNYLYLDIPTGKYLFRGERKNVPFSSFVRVLNCIVVLFTDAVYLHNTDTSEIVVRYFNPEGFVLIDHKSLEILPGPIFKINSTFYLKIFGRNLSIIGSGSPHKILKECVIGNREPLEDHIFLYSIDREKMILEWFEYDCNRRLVRFTLDIFKLDKNRLNLLKDVIYNEDLMNAIKRYLIL